MERRRLTWPTHAAGGIAALWLLTLTPGPATRQALLEPAPSGAPYSSSIIPTSLIISNPAVSGQNIGALALVAALAALLPDLDAPRSKIRSLTMGPFRPLDPLGDLLYGAWGHRGPLHSLLGLTVFGLLFALPLSLLFGWLYGAAALLGYASHLALDAMTRHGIPLLPEQGKDGRWSLKHRRHLLPRSLRFVTGSAAEDVLQAVLLGADLALLLRYLA